MATVDCLITSVVDGFGLAVEVRGDGHNARSLNDLGKGGVGLCVARVGPLPIEGHVGCVVLYAEASGTQGYCSAWGGYLQSQRSLFPSLAVAHNALPNGMAGYSEGHLDLGGLQWFEAEDLYDGSCGLGKLQAGADDFGVVANQK